MLVAEAGGEAGEDGAVADIAVDGGDPLPGDLIALAQPAPEGVVAQFLDGPGVVLENQGLRRLEVLLDL